MAEGISFFTPLIFKRATSSWEKAAETVDSYFSFYDGKVAYVISPCDPQSRLSLALLEDSHEGPQLGITVAKILSYYTLVIPLLMLALKAILRWSLPVRVIEKSSLPESSTTAKTATLFEAKSAGSKDPLTAFFEALPTSVKAAYSPEEPLIDFFKGPLSKLRDLNLRGKSLRIIPDEITYLYHLQTLDLSRNPIKDLPSRLPANLTALNISDTKITSLPEDFALPASLEMVVISASQRALGEQLAALAEKRRGGGAASQVLPLHMEII